jgi:hypothetical protein
MPARLLGVVGGILIAVGGVSQASAGWFCDFFRGVADDTRTRRVWPEPYVQADRAAARAAFATAVENGWRRQNMLGEFHFESATGQLTEAGKLKVQWILTTCPSQHRIVYVHAAYTDAKTAARMAAVVQQVHLVAPSNPSPVLSTTIPDEGWPAQRVDQISRKFMSSTPTPRLPDDIANTAGGGGGSSGSGGGG